MANAVLVHRTYAAVGNAVYVQRVSLTSTVPAGNAVLVQAVALSSAAPTANAGPDQANVEPATVVTIDASGSTYSPGTTIASYAIAQTAGPAVTLTGTGPTWSFVAPSTMNGVSLAFRVTVTDSGGAKSFDDINVAVLNSTEFTRIADAWVPNVVNSRLGGVWL